MRAVRLHSFTGRDNLTIESVIDPVCGARDVVIKVEAAGLNFADLLVVDGTYQRLPALPFTPGKEASGTVVAVGPEVDDVREGDRVFALVDHGAWSEKLLAPATSVTRIPQLMSFEQAAAFGLSYCTAYFALVRRAAIGKSEVVAVTGASGGVGSAAVALAKAMGARVIAVTRREQNDGFLRGIGADDVVVSTAGALRDRLKHLTDGRGVDVVVDTVGGDTFRELLRATAWEGRVVIVGFASGEQHPVMPGHLLVKNVSLLGLQVSDYIERTPALLRDAMAVMKTYFEEGRLPIAVASTYALGDVGIALEALASGTFTGAAVLAVNEADDTMEDRHGSGSQL